MVLESEMVANSQTDTSPENSNSNQPDTLGEIIVAQLKALQEYHRAVLENADVDAIHKMRVTTRRLQASLDLLQFKDDELDVKKIKKRLRKWRQVLSVVRNYDVFLIVLDNDSSSRRPVKTERFKLLKSILRERRERRARKATLKLTQINITGIATKLGLGLADPIPTNGDNPVSEETSHPGASQYAILGVDKKKIALHTAERLEQRLSEFLSLAAQSHPSTDPADLHQLRIAAKRVRYILEIVSQMGYGDASRGLGYLRTLQDKIGDWHDLESIEEEILGIVTRRNFIKENLAESGRMLQEAAYLKNKKEALVARLFPVKVPKTLTTTSERLASALRRDAAPDTSNA